MPKWGLTEAQRDARPWGLLPDDLMPKKVDTDPIHGDIFLTELEQAFVDTPPFQRLRRIKQLGNTHLVYPGGTHSRFAHSIGCVRVAQDLIDAVLDQRNTPRVEPDLFQQWDVETQEAIGLLFERARANEGLDDANVGSVFKSLSAYDRRVAEATVAARLGALLHDLCHVPFGHSIEDELDILTAHDKNEDRFERLWEAMELRPDLEDRLKAGGLYAELRSLILPKVDGRARLRYPFVEDIVGNTICADLLDYLERDHRMLGLPIALGRRFVSSFYVTPKGDPETGEHMALRLTRDGRERIDVVTEVLKYLRYRYELSERALVHHAKVAADAMIGKALSMRYDLLWLEEANRALRETHEASGKSASAYRRPRWLSGSNIGEVRERYRAQAGDDRAAELGKAAIRSLDVELSGLGDDELIRHLADIHHTVGNPNRAAAVRRLAIALRDRNLFKPVATRRNPPLGAEKTFERWGKPEDRRRIEEDAADWAGLPHKWQILLWVPPETMRLKIADVLVSDGEDILRFFEYEERGKGRGQDIYKAHRGLWELVVCMHPDYARGDEHELTRMRAVARVAQQMNITFPLYEAELGKKAYLWPDRLAAREAIKTEDGPTAADDQPGLVEDLIKQVRGSAVQARGRQANESWDALFSLYRETAAARSESAT